jgi:hypothetical protein
MKILNTFPVILHQPTVRHQNDISYAARHQTMDTLSATWNLLRMFFVPRCLESYRMCKCVNVKGKWTVGSEEREASVVILCEQYHSILTKVLGTVDYIPSRNRTYHRAVRKAAASNGNRHTRVIEEDRRFDPK